MSWHRVLARWALAAAIAAAAFAAERPVRAVGYELGEAPCLYARDLPLIASMGASTVRTYGALPEGDRVFQAVLESTGLEWVAGFRVDPAREPAETLAAFRAYATRFRGEAHLAGFVLDGAGAELVDSAAAIARELDARWAVSVAFETAAEFQGERETDLFESVPSGEPGIEELKPHRLYNRLAWEWGGTYPAAWSEQSQPHLAPAGPASAGALVRLAGKALLNPGAPYKDEAWPFHLGGSCLCAGSQPARLSYVGAQAVTAQVPPTLEPGQTRLVYYRAGRASNSVWLHIGEFSAGTRTEPPLEARLH